jgi:hypothetical protein
LDLKPPSPAPSSTQDAARSAESERDATESERDATDGDEAAREGDETPTDGDESARPKEAWLPSSALSCDLMQLLRSCVCVPSPRIELSLVQTTPHAHGQGATYRIAIYTGMRTRMRDGLGWDKKPVGAQVHRPENGGSWCFAGAWTWTGEWVRESARPQPHTIPSTRPPAQ